MSKKHPKRLRNHRRYVYICTKFLCCNIGQDALCTFKNRFKYQNKRWKHLFYPDENWPPTIACSKDYGWLTVAELNNVTDVKLKSGYEPIKLIRTSIKIKKYNEEDEPLLYVDAHGGRRFIHSVYTGLSSVNGTRAQRAYTYRVRASKCYVKS